MTQAKLDVIPMLAMCWWSTIYDAYLGTLWIICDCFNIGSASPANTIHRPNAGLMLARRLRRRPNINPALGQYISCLLGRWQWANIKPALCQHIVFVGISPSPCSEDKLFTLTMMTGVLKHRCNLLVLVFYDAFRFLSFEMYTIRWVC